MYKD
jgi:ribonucleotide reductase beta subunit family protein with ferritin-like domain